MKRTATSLLLITALILSAVAGPVGTVAAQDGTPTPTPGDEDDAKNTSGTSLSVGQQLGVVIDTQSTDIKTELDDARFRHRLKHSIDRESAARERADTLRTDVTELREQRATLIESFREGNISKSEFLARLSTVNHRLDKKAELTTRAEVEARTYGVNSSALAELRANAATLRNSQLSAIARQVAAKGHTPVTVATDDEGNVQFRTEDGDRIGVEYRVRGSENISFDLARDNGTTFVTITDKTGAPIKGANVRILYRTSNANATALIRDAGVTNANGTIAIESDARLNRVKKLAITAEHNGESSTIEVRRQNVPKWKTLDKFREKHDDRREDARERIRERANETEDRENHNPDRKKRSDEKRSDEDNVDTREDGRDNDDHPRSDKREADRPLELGVGVNGKVVTVTVFKAGAPVADATVTSDGEFVGKTNASGTFEFEPNASTAADGEVELTVKADDREAEITVEIEATSTGGGETNDRED